MIFLTAALPSAVIFASCAGVVGAGSRPSESSFSRTAGSSSALRASAFNRLTIVAGVPLGAYIATQVAKLKPATPPSAKVGTSGKSGERFSVGTPKAMSLPCLIKGKATEVAENMTGTCPDTTSIRLCDAPL